ncbi:aminotransferase class I/II-fold pyridoxal phosphate-dependent enzyme [Candidatus Bathyarchaeota archaeon]|nr:MAG: aminotransferase class I/II-fold pyridoxal phosphate-dependent enzyme [Candidatus Bathyarchaeota archaeon]
MSVKRHPTKFLREEYLALVEQSLDWKLKTVEGPSKPVTVVDGREVLLLCSNNYLGLATHPKLIEAAVEAAKEYGVGSGAVRAISGTMSLHMELERRLARWKRAEAALTYPTGFMVNSGLIPQLVDKGDLIVSEELNHGSIIDGCRLSRADRVIYRHTDMEHLAQVLDEAEKHKPPYRRILIITDGVFSMDGDIAPLDEIVKLAEEHGAMVYVDDAHGEGVLGEGGRGIVSHFHLNHDQVHVDMGTFSKAYGTVGGHICGSEDLIRFAWNKSRTWLLSSSLPPPVVAATIAAIDVLETEPWHVRNLWKNTNYFRKAVQDLGFNTGRSQTPIIPIIVGESSKAKKLSEKLYERGIYVTPIVYPMVARDQARIRIQMHAQLTQEDLDRVIEALEEIGKELDII